MNNFPILIYDKECTMCTRFKQALENLPGSRDISFIPLQEDEIFKTYPKLDPLQCADSVHLLIDEEKFLVGPEVVKYLIKTIPGISKLSWLLDKEAGNKAVDLFYKSINTYRKSKWNPCPKCKD